MPVWTELNCTEPLNLFGKNSPCLPLNVAEYFPPSGLAVWSAASERIWRS